MAKRGTAAAGSNLSSTIIAHEERLFRQIFRPSVGRTDFFVLPCVCVCLRQINSPPPFHLPSHPSHNTASGFDISACVCSYVVVPHTCTYITCAAAAFKNEGGPAGQTLCRRGLHGSG